MMKKEKKIKIKRINIIMDLIPARGALPVRMDELPKGKPVCRNSWAYGPARIVTYIFKSGEVYRKVTFKEKALLFHLDKWMIDLKGNLICEGRK